jgi:hypothetical protein
MPKLFERKYIVIFIMAVNLLCIFSKISFSNDCQKIVTDKRVGLENSKLRFEFSRDSGALVRLFNVETGGEYFKTLSTKGNPFRVFVNPTKEPAFIHKWDESFQPDQNSVGGKIIDTSKCKLTDYRFSETDGGLSLTLISRCDSSGLSFELTVNIQPNEVAANMQLTVKNESDKPARIMLAFPYFEGLGLGNDSNTNLGMGLYVFGQPRSQAWRDAGDIYGRLWASQWDAVYEPSSQEAIGIIVEDSNLINKALQRHAGGIMNVFYFDNLELAQNKTVKFPQTKLLIYKGDWKLTAVRYGRWFRENFKVRRTPDWLKEVEMFVGAWIPLPSQHQGIYIDREIAPLPFEFKSFTDMPRLYLLPDMTWDNSGKYDLKEWAFYWEGVNRHKIYAAFQHTDGIYDFRKDLGGVAKFREGVVGVEKNGRYVGLYVASMTVRNDSEFFMPPNPGAGTTPKDWLLMPTPDAKLPEPEKNGHQSFFMSPRNPAWQDYLASKIKDLLRQTGAKYVRLDEFGSTFVIDYNPKYIKNPYHGTPEVREFLRKIRCAIDEVDPNIALFAEGATDITALYVDGTLCMCGSGLDIDPMRLVLPEFVGFSYSLGQVDCALQGYVCAVENAANNSYADYRLEKKPVGYPEPPKGKVWPEKKLRWHELAYTFKDAARGNDPILENPVAVGVNPESWAGRIWKSPKYWLLVCGNRWAERPKQPVRVKLPELPADIKYAFEFDVETLSMRQIEIERTENGVYLNTNYGFSAVLLPKPDCPALIELSESNIDITPGQSKTIDLKAICPWRKDGFAPVVNCEVPGLTVLKGQNLVIPCIITIKTDLQTEKGYYYLKVNGNCLPLKRWFRLN